MGALVGRFAVLRGGVIENLIAWDEVATWSPPEGTATIEVLTPDEPIAQISGTYANGKFIKPVQIGLQAADSAELAIITDTPAAGPGDAPS